MKTLGTKNWVYILSILFFILPATARASVHYNEATTTGSVTDNNVTIAISMDSISDINGCDISTCKYWQIHVMQAVGDWGRYFSSDVFPASQLTAVQHFKLPPGRYRMVLLIGYDHPDVGFCGYQIPGDPDDACPDGKHVTGATNGLVAITDPDLEANPLIINDVLTDTIPLTSAVAEELINQSSLATQGTSTTTTTTTATTAADATTTADFIDHSNQAGVFMSFESTSTSTSTSTLATSTDATTTADF